MRAAISLARFFSEHAVALSPFTFVSVSTGIPNASQNLTKAAAFLHPIAESVPSNSSAVLPSSSYTFERLATAPTVIPFRRMNPVTISFA